MKTRSRRQFLKYLTLGTLAATSLLTLSACQGIQPQPFTTGRTITPPQGCSELLKRDRLGDC